jgi:hypothetical protein
VTRGTPVEILREAVDLQHTAALTWQECGQILAHIDWIERRVTRAVAERDRVDPCCLQCGQRKSDVRTQSLFCCTIGGGESPEVDQEWAHHRWADWHDDELTRFGVKPEAFDKHRRTDASTFQWIACDDTVRGHHFVDDVTEFDWVEAGRCVFCYQAKSAL